jgi:micrococcal nuclease
MTRMKNKKIIAFAGAILIVAVIAIIVFRASGRVKAKGIVAIDPNAYYKVMNVIDGDTFQASIDGKIITVRVLGINTPETVDPRKPVECYGPEASAEGKELLAGAEVRLEFNPNREKLDKYGRYLLYVYRKDGLFYNESMIQNGYAYEYTFNNEPYTMQSEFRKAEATAKASGVGLWKACPVKG